MIFYQTDNNDIKQLDIATVPILSGDNLKLWQINSTKPDTIETALNQSPYQLTLPNQQAQIDNLNNQIQSQYEQLSNFAGQIGVLTYENSLLQAVANIRPPIIDLNTSNVYKDTACTQLATVGDNVRGWKSGNFVLTSDNNNLLTSNGVRIARAMTTINNIPKNRLTIEIVAYCASGVSNADLYSTGLSGTTRDYVRFFSTSFNWAQYASDNTQILSAAYTLTTQNATNTIKIVKDYDTLSLYVNGTLTAIATSAKLQLVPDRFSVGSNDVTPDLHIKSLKIWDYPN